MRRTIPGALLALMLITTPVTAFAQETPATPLASPVAAEATPVAAVSLVPYANETVGLASVVPDGWSEVAPGTFAREVVPGDPTVAALQVVPRPPDAVLGMLLPQLLLTEAPDPTGEYQAASLTWTLYHIEVESPIGPLVVDLALAPGDGETLIVVVQSVPAEAATNYAAIFEPMLAATVPLAAPEASPVAYQVEDVTFTNGEVTLAGTLTMPPGPGPHPAVVLVSGSGPQDRNETLAGIPIQPFRLLADALTSNGIAVLRYDDRGVGKSTGDFDTATMFDLASDADAAIAYLLTRPEIDGDQLGLLGHSEGGLIAAYLGARNDDLDFIISLAGPGVTGGEVLLLQNELILRATGAPEDAIATQVAFIEAAVQPDADPEAVRELAYDAILASVEELPAEQRAEIGDVEAYARQQADAVGDQLTGPVFQAFIHYDPRPDWAQVTVPVLAIFGGKDLQVDAEQSAGPLELALDEAGNDDVTVVVVPGVNHLFQTTETGDINEYASLPAEFDPALLPVILDWLAARISTEP